MHPAFSVIAFTTLSGAGYGVLALAGLGLFAPVLGMPGPSPLVLSVMLALGLALATIGLLSSTFHLGKPLRAWRAFSQWRTSWLSREGVMAVLVYLPALALLALLVPAAIGRGEGVPAPLAAVLGAVLALLSLVTLACTAMIYASLKPIPAWGHRLVLPAYLLFGLQGGLALTAAVAAFDDGRMAAGLLVAVALPGLALAGVKLRYWRAIDSTPLPVTRGDAVGLPGREIRVFERPHTEGNYITREMGFVLARKHARALRHLAIALFAVLPLLLAALGLGFEQAVLPLALLALASVLLGAFVERWLFFAQARHVVGLYY
ncbi:dimethyl sulfoxide reductase anchor subunit family protein [Marilutibacter aestuarii]|uniref:Dimethyl sulfoxide reductase anchor subunit n=1 Tax=Marilutibacter aestuarii TaxID=1706195 RepID=A0A508ANN9_9GAMM|nr:DmsC/YnfH family molybdoenzyme membrane anchor subunit [Lysobacter aestuarii]TQD51379.1 dimethyl sulfoxide reductase anchor subunit [Lysobacter aestuarii]